MELTGRTLPMRLLAAVLGPDGGLLGAGLAALAAHELTRRDYEVSVLKAQDCPVAVGRTVRDGLRHSGHTDMGAARISTPTGEVLGGWTPAPGLFAKSYRSKSDSPPTRCGSGCDP